MTKYEIDSELTKLAKQKAPSCVSEYSSVYCSFPWRRIFTESVKSTLSGGKMVCRNGKMQGYFLQIIDYRLLPKNKYPVPVEDCYCTYQWVLDYADMLGINQDKIVVAGDSAGGNLAAAVTLMLWDRVRISPLGAVLIYPVIDRRIITGSMKKFTDTPVWDATRTKMFWNAYLGN